MNLKIIKNLLIAGIFIPAIASAVTEDDFKMKTTKNLLNLCTASVDDPQYEHAIHFCQGYLLGAYHYHASEHNGDNGNLLVCFPDPPPTRNEAVKKVISWIQQHPEFMGELPVETEFRALTELWPCKNNNIFK